MFVRLLMKADDYGRFHAEPRRLKAALFPLVENLRATDVTKWLVELTNRHLILCYQSSDDRQLLAIPRFGQRLKQSVPKFPAPPGMPDNWMPDDGGLHPDSRAPQPTSGSPPPTSGKFPEVPARDGDGDVKPLAQPDGFARFWEQYPKKRSKGDAEKAWKAIRPDRVLLDRILQAIAQAKLTDDWQKSGGQFIPYPATWLRAKGWEDIVSTESAEQSQVPDLASIEASRRAGIEAMKARMLAETVPPARSATGGPG